jgi:hypothetical protein
MKDKNWDMIRLFESINKTKVKGLLIENQTQQNPQDMKTSIELHNLLINNPQQFNTRIESLSQIPVSFYSGQDATVNTDGSNRSNSPISSDDLVKGNLAQMVGGDNLKITTDKPIFDFTQNKKYVKGNTINLKTLPKSSANVLPQSQQSSNTTTQPTIPIS